MLLVLEAWSLHKESSGPRSSLKQWGERSPFPHPVLGDSEDSMAAVSRTSTSTLMFKQQPPCVSLCLSPLPFSSNNAFQWISSSWDLKSTQTLFPSNFQHSGHVHIFLSHHSTHYTLSSDGNFFMSWGSCQHVWASHHVVTHLRSPFGSGTETHLQQCQWSQSNGTEVSLPHQLVLSEGLRYL